MMGELDVRVAHPIVLKEDVRRKLERQSRGRSTAARVVLRIGEYIDCHNEKPKPFIWTEKANEILEKVTRAKTALYKRRSA